MSQNSSATQTIGFLLTPNFALMSYASATEPLRAANLLAQSPLYEVVPFSVDGAPVMASCGLAVPCRAIAEATSPVHTLFVVAGGNPSDWRSATAAYPHVRRLSRQGCGLVAFRRLLSLAEAGLLNRHAFTIHWEYAAALAEAFPELQPKQAVMCWMASGSPAAAGWRRWT